MKKTLIIIDVQHDFCKGGVLAAKDTDTLIAPINRLTRECSVQGIPCFFTRDWHPANHRSFHSQGGPWPVHCVQGTWGASFPAELTIPEGSVIVDKETLPDQVSYSDFQSTGLEDQLRALQVEEIAVCGIATEYCVKAGTIDALKLGFRVVVLTDLVRPIEATRVVPARQGGARRPSQYCECLCTVAPVCYYPWTHSALRNALNLHCLAPVGRRPV
jgi:nicotinamidase/pyrazinamidase